MPKNEVEEETKGKNKGRKEKREGERKKEEERRKKERNKYVIPLQVKKIRGTPFGVPLMAGQPLECKFQQFSCFDATVKVVFVRLLTYDFDGLVFACLKQLL